SPLPTSSPSTRYSLKCPSLRIVMCRASSVGWSACGKSQARTGRSSDPVRSPVNHSVEAVKMSAAQRTAGIHLRSGRPLSDKLGDGPGDERERLVVELRVDEALDLLALRRVALAAGAVRELRAGQQVEVLQHRGVPAGIAARQLLVEGEADGEERE